MESKRADVYIAEAAGISRSAAQILISEGRVTVNGKTVKNNYAVRDGDIVEWEIPPAVPSEISAEDIPLDIFYEDEHLIVINKPRGMVVHPAAGHYEGTLVNALLNHCGGSLSGINGVQRPGIVHRIDKETSGLLVAAKTNAAHGALAAQLAAHTTERVYTAVCVGVVKNDSFTVDRPIGRNPSDRKKMAVILSPQVKSRKAVTHVTVARRYKRFTLIEARLETGRTHQIRVHMAHIGHPLLGDMIYGLKKQPLGIKTQMLHAKRIGFIHPATGENLTFEAEPPQDFIETLEKLK